MNNIHSARGLGGADQRIRHPGGRPAAHQRAGDPGHRPQPVPARPETRSRWVGKAIICFN